MGNKKNVFLLFLTSVWLLPSYFKEWKHHLCSSFFTVSEQLTSIYGSRKGILTSVIELSPLRLELPFCQNYLEKYQGVPTVQGYASVQNKTWLKLEGGAKHLALRPLFHIENSWQRCECLPLFSCYWSPASMNSAIYQESFQTTELKNPVYFNPVPKFLPSDSIPHSGHWKPPIFHWWYHQESLHQSVSAQVPESGFDYQLDDAGLIPGTN